MFEGKFHRCSVLMLLPGPTESFPTVTQSLLSEETAVKQEKKEIEFQKGCKNGYDQCGQENRKAVNEKISTVSANYVKH